MIDCKTDELRSSYMLASSSAGSDRINTPCVPRAYAHRDPRADERPRDPGGDDAAAATAAGGASGGHRLEGMQLANATGTKTKQMSIASHGTSRAEQAVDANDSQPGQSPAHSLPTEDHAEGPRYKRRRLRGKQAAGADIAFGIGHLGRPARGAGAVEGQPNSGAAATSGTPLRSSSTSTTECLAVPDRNGGKLAACSSAQCTPWPTRGERPPGQVSGAAA